MSSFRTIVLLVLSCWAALAAVDVGITASDPWGNKAGGGDPVTFTVVRSGSTSSALTVNLTISGTAVPGTDYPAVPNLLTMPAGQASAVLRIVPNTWAPGRTGTPPSIILSLAAGGYAITGGQASATAYIAQNSTINSGGEDMAITMRRVTTSTGGNYELNIPQRNGVDIAVVRGVLVSAPGDGGSDSCSDFDRWCYDQCWAYLSQKFASDTAANPIKALGALAGTAGHAELQYAPLCARGFSRGGGLASALAKAYPERMIAFYARGWVRPDWSGTAPYAPSAATAAVPGWFDTGTVDGYAGVMRTSFERGRASGALWCYSEYSGEGHGADAATEIAREFFAACIALRYDYQPGITGKDPRLGAVTLSALSETGGWIGEHLYGRNRGAYSSLYSAEIPNWHKDFETRNPFVSLLGSFDRTDTGTAPFHRQHSWLPNERVARLWAQHTGKGWDSIALQFPQGAPAYLVNAGQAIPSILDTGGFPEAVKAEFYVDETKVGDDTSAPFTCTYAITATGGHVLWAKAIAADGAVRITSSHKGSRLGWGDRYIRIRPANELGDTAPTISQIPKIRLRSGDSAGVNIPFTIADAETSPDNLTVDNTAWRITWPFNGTHAITGTGANRKLTIADLGSPPGFYHGSIKVSDGFLSAEQGFDVEILPAAGNNSPRFVEPSIGNVTVNACDGMWSDIGTFTVSDGDTDLSRIVTTFTNSNPSKLPSGNIRLANWGPVRSLQVRTITDGWNGTSLHLSLSDGSNTTSAVSDVSFANVPGQTANEAPWISVIPDQTCSGNSQTQPYIFRLGDLNWHPSELVVTATSSNTSLLPNANIAIATLGNSRIDRERSITCRPASGASGSAVITVTVSEPGANPVAPAGPLSTTRSFRVTVSPTAALPTVSLSATPASIAEAGGVARVTATLSAAAANAVVVSLATSGTAATGSDYVLSATSITIPVGQSTGSMTVTAVQDTLVEGSENVILDIASVTNATGSGAQRAVVSILDDDVAPVTYAIAYNGNGAGSGTVPATQIKTQGIALALSGNIGGLARTGYAFAGWNTAANGSGTAYAAGSNYTADSSAILYAAWTASVLPVGWSSQAIGVASPAGSATGDGDSLTISGAGADIWGRSDAFRYAWQPVNGSFDAVVQVLSQSNTGPWAKAGLMVRESTNADSRNAAVLVTPGNGTAMQYRAATGGTSSHISGPQTGVPTWLKLSRRGTSFTAYQSSDGTTWKLISTRTIALPSGALLGLAVTSHANGTLSTATFSGYSVAPVASN